MRRYILLLLGAAHWVVAQENLQEIRRTTKSVEKETARERDLHQAEKKRHAEFAENSRKKVQVQEEQAQILRSQIDSLKAEALRLEAARQEAAGSTKWIDARKVKYREGLARSIEALAKSLEQDIPFKHLEAAESTKEVALQLRKGNLSPDEALGRAFDLLQDRIQMGYTTENWSGYLAWQGRSIAGKFVRYGAVSAIFVSQDQEDIFWLIQTQQGYEWKPVGANLALRGVLKDALRVAEGKTPPRLVLLPFAVKEYAQ